jgi:hypothetical protein
VGRIARREAVVKPFLDLWGLQAVVATALVAGLPVGLAVWTWRPAWLASMGNAAGPRRTAAVLWGAGLLFLAVLAFAVFWNHAPARILAVCVLAAAAANVYAGFAAGAWEQGRSMLRRDGGLGCVCWGWLARTSMVLVPVLGAIAAAYFVALAFGTPFVAWRQKSTVEPSAGSTPVS